MKNRIRDDNYYQISGWMINKLGLSGNRLLVYAVIYGFSQDGESGFCGGLDYLVQLTGASRRTVINTLNDLTDAGLLEKRPVRKRGVEYSSYICTSAKTAPVQEMHQCKNDPEVVQKLHSGSAKIAPNNKEIIKDNKDNTPYIPPGKYDPAVDLESRGVDKQVIDDWLTLRKAKRASVTQTAIDGLAREAGLSGKTLNDVLQICCENGWQGFRASWLQTRGSQHDENKRVLDELTGRSHGDASRTIDAETRLIG